MPAWPALVAAALLAVLLAVVAPSPALAAYPPPPGEDAEPIPPAPDPAPAPTPRPPAPAPTPDPEDEPDGPTPQPDEPLPTPDPDPDPVPAPPPTPDPPVLEPGTGTGDRDGEPIDVRVRPRPDPDDPVLERIPGVEPRPDGTLEGLPPREDGTPREPRLDQTVLVEAGPLALAVVGEACGGELTDLDPSGALMTTPGGALALRGGGFLGEADAAAWLYSDPRFLASETTLTDGSLGLVARVPGDHPVGRHVAQLTGTGADGAAYRVSLDVVITACDTGAGLLGLGGAGAAGLVGLLLAGALLAGAGWLLIAWRTLRIRVVALPGLAPLPVAMEDTRAVASRGRRTTDAEVRGGWSGLDERDRALDATDLVVDDGRVLDLDRDPVPAGAVVLVEAAGATWVLAVRDADGTFIPAAEGDLPRLVPDGSVVMTVDGLRRRGRLQVTLGSLGDEESDDDRALAQEVLGHLRADASGRVRGEVLLPDDLGTLPLVLGIRMRGR